MIGVDYNLPFVDMDKYIDIDKFLSMSEEICRGISKSNFSFASSGSRTYGLENYPDVQMPYDSEIKYKDLTKDLKENERRIFLKYYKKVWFGTSGLFIKKNKGYLNKHLAKFSEYTENAEHFPNFINYIENDLPFEQIGRVFIFLQDHLAPLAEHRDSMDNNYKNELTDFLWFTIDKNSMKFWIRDNNDQKHYINSTCAWFNENDRHGSDGVVDATFCIRVDGVFKPEFKTMILNELK